MFTCRSALPLDPWLPVSSQKRPQAPSTVHSALQTTFSPTVGLVICERLVNMPVLMLLDEAPSGSSIYKIPMMSRWLVITPGFDKVEEIRRAPDDVLSAQEAVADVSAHIYCPQPQ